MLETLATQSAQLGSAAPLLFALLLLVSTVVPFSGYSALLVAAGYLFGLRLGFVLVYPTSVLGSCLAFIIGRRLPIRLRQKLPPKVIQLQTLIGDGGFSALFLLRCIPIPFALSSLFLGSISPPIPLRTYALANAAALVRLVANVYLGENARRLLDGDGNEGDARQASKISACVSMGGVLALLALTGTLGRRALVRRAAAQGISGKTNSLRSP